MFKLRGGGDTAEASMCSLAPCDSIAGDATCCAVSLTPMSHVLGPETVWAVE